MARRCVMIFQWYIEKFLTSKKPAVFQMYEKNEPAFKKQTQSHYSYMHIHRHTTNLKTKNVCMFFLDEVTCFL